MSFKEKRGNKRKDFKSSKGRKDLEVLAPSHGLNRTRLGIKRFE